MDELIESLNNNKIFISAFEKSLVKYSKQDVIDYLKEHNDLYTLGLINQYYYKDYDLMKKYYLDAIALGDSNAMCNLGWYYQYTDMNYELMKKYYLDAIALGNSKAMKNLGYYYQYNEKKYDLMTKYYLDAIALNNSYAMLCLGIYYESIRDYKLMVKYCNMATKLGNIEAKTHLKKYNRLFKIIYSLKQSKTSKTITLNIKSFNDDKYKKMIEFMITNEVDILKVSATKAIKFKINTISKGLEYKKKIFKTAKEFNKFVYNKIKLYEYKHYDNIDNEFIQFKIDMVDNEFI